MYIEFARAYDEKKILSTIREVIENNLPLSALCTAVLYGRRLTTIATRLVILLAPRQIFAITEKDEIEATPCLQRSLMIMMLM